MFLLHGFKTVDIWFFVICAIIIVLIVIIYFLIPVFKRKQFAEARKNLARRETLFRQNQEDELLENISVDSESEDKSVAMEVDSTEKEESVASALSEEEINQESIIEPLDSKVTMDDFMKSEEEKDE